MSYEYVSSRQAQRCLPTYIVNTSFLEYSYILFYRNNLGFFPEFSFRLQIFPNILKVALKNFLEFHNKQTAFLHEKQRETPY